jgi:hypothetical protein
MPRKNRIQTCLATAILETTWPARSMSSLEPIGVSAAVAVVTDRDSQIEQRDERASPLKPNVDREVREVNEVSFEV